MDEAEGVEGDGGYGCVGGDSGDQFHRNEAISAVADEGFLVEEDDDYDDLYNDVNVGEGFLQSLKKNDESGFGNEEENRGEPQPPSTSMSVVRETSGQPISRVGGGEGERKCDRDAVLGGCESETGVSGSRLDGYQNQGFIDNDIDLKEPVPPRPGTGTATGTGGGGGGSAYGGGLRVELGQSSSKAADVQEKLVNNSMALPGVRQLTLPNGMGVSSHGNEATARQIVGAGNMNGAGGNIGGGGSHGGAAGGGGVGAVLGGSTILFVGDLHWWTTDAELETELVKYGPVKEVKFFDEKASGKSKGYCQVEFYDPAAATACKEGMNGHVFNGRPCVVAFASPFTVKRMGEAQANRSQLVSQQGPAQTRRGTNDAGNYKAGGSNIAAGGNHQGGDNNNRGYGRGNWGRGNAQGMGNRGPIGPVRNRPGGMSGRGIMGNGGSGFGQGVGANPPLMHPQAMMGQGFDPAFGGPMGRMGSYWGFPGAPAPPPFPGILSSFPPVGTVGFTGVAPHVNPAFFARGMPMNGMAMGPNSGVDGPNMGMWSDPNIGVWAGDDHSGRVAESSYVEEPVSDHQYGESSHDRGGWMNSMKEKDRVPERDWSGTSDRRYLDDRDPNYDREMPREKDMGHDHDWAERRHHDDKEVERERDRHRESSRDRVKDRDHDRGREKDRYRDDRDRYADHHKYMDHEPEFDDEWDRGRSSRTHSKSRVVQEEAKRPRSRDSDYGKRRRMTSE
ncbi:hypothetical protein Nepgr_027336 [Nepenthes gracilis]|uniref:RRM domain-containing protein n=1 Tax=Nepenthes gracilis TaxID=150966 RepID=A0AAD3TA74_NEPGR|nr:hypothetical protein Nepgr_027336 [Nepenthes gracilis]